MSVIFLTQGREALVDYQDLDALLGMGTWCFSSSGYAVHYCLDPFGQRKVLYMHRVVQQRAYGQPIPPHLQVDHINRDRLDCRRENLRFALRQQNQANKSIAINNTSGYKGVTFAHGKFSARIKFYSRRLHLGSYDDPITAALVYDAASRYLYKEFAGCNFPDIPTSPQITEMMHRALARYQL